MKKRVTMKIVLCLLLGLSLLIVACGQADTPADPGGGGEAVTADPADVDDDDDDVDDGEVEFGWVNAMPNFTVGDTFRAETQMELSLLFRELPSYLWDDEWPIVTMLRDKTNVNFAGNTVAVLIDDFHHQRQLLIAAGTAPEVMPVMYGQYVAQFVPGGAMLPFSEYWDHMPHFQHFMTEWDLWDDLEWSRQADGHIYHLSGIQEDVALRFTVLLRYDILRDLGLEVPDTWDEIRDVLRVVAEAFPGTYPFRDRWDMSSTLNISARTFGVRFGWGMGNGLILNHDTQEYQFITQMPELRDFTEFWHSMFAEGLVDPESMTDDEPAWAAFVNGESMMVGGFWQDAPGFYNDMAENLAEGVEPGPFGIEGAEIVTLPVPNGPTGRVGIARLNNGLILNNSIREREDFIAVLQFIDWLYYSEEGREFAIWGVEGETFEWVDGRRQLLPGFRAVGWGGQDNEDYQLMAEIGFNQNVFSATHGGSQELTVSIVNDDLRALHIANSTRVPHPVNPAPPFDELEQEQASIIAGQLTDMTNMGVRQFMIGHRDMAEWDAFIQEVEAAGVDRLVDLANGALQRHLGN